MLSETAVRAKVEAWAEAWNRRDAPAVARHYAPDVEYVSPVAGGLRGAGALERHVRRMIALHPELRIEVLHVLRGDRGVTIVHRGPDGRVAAEIMCLGDDGRAARSSVHLGEGAASGDPQARKMPDGLRLSGPHAVRAMIGGLRRSREGGATAEGARSGSGA